MRTTNATSAWRNALLGGLLSVASCGGVEVPPEGLPELFAAVEADPALNESVLDGCVQIHHLWKLQVRAVHRTARAGVRARVRMLVDSVRVPFASFWDGYVSSGFERWARTELDLANDPRSGIPIRIDVAELIEDVTMRIAQSTGRRACVEWYLVYGPGWTNLGGLGTGEMIIDFFGLPKSGGVKDIERWLPHEIAHVIHGSRGHDPDRGTLLSAITSEGFASYFAYRYWKGSITPWESVGYSESEWQWALQHEAELWELASQDLAATDRDVITQYRSRSSRVPPQGPTAIGYFLGYRMAESFVAENGADSYHEIFDLPVEQVLVRSGFTVP